MSDNFNDACAEKFEALSIIEQFKARQQTKMVMVTEPTSNHLSAALSLARPVVQHSIITVSRTDVETSDTVEARKPKFVDRMIDHVGIGQRVNIVDINIPERMKVNISTGMPKIDILMAGDGVTPSTVCLVTGVPGGGKSTLMVQLADAITKAGNIAVYNMCEESLVQLAKTAQRLHIKNGFYVSSHRNVFDLVEHVEQISEEHPEKQVFLFCDSLQTLELPHVQWDEKTGKMILDENGNSIKATGRIQGDQMAAVHITEILATWAKTTFGIVFVVGQVNKDGEMAGRQAIKHWIDVHMHLSIQVVKDVVGGKFSERICEITKNRFGIANIFFPFELEARGVKFVDARPKK